MNWLKYTKLYFLISATLISISIYALATWGLNLGVDFRGGAVLEYKFEDSIDTQDVTKKIEEKGIDVSSIQSTSDSGYIFRFPPIDLSQKEEIENQLKELYGETFEEIRFETVGPAIGPELVKKTFYAILIAALAILIWVAFQFKSLKFGASAILAMFHDSFILLGSFAVLGHFTNADFDFLIVTALLTTLSFSVHDTIVVFDRIRESQNNKYDDLGELANNAITETMVRSLNNSFTIIFMLVALILLGGTTIQWFAIALLIGTVLGTYSSPFVAVPLLVTADDLIKKTRSVDIKSKLPKPKIAALRK